MDDAAARIQDLAGLLTPMAIRVAATLRLADHLEAGTTQLADLADRTETDPDALAGLLGHLVSVGVFEAPEPGVFALNDLGRGLLDANGVRGWLDLTGIGSRIDLTYTGLLESIRTGGPCYASVYGRPWWEDITSDPKLDAEFHELMTGGHAERHASFVEAYDWSQARQVVDVGGGDGGLLTKLLDAEPDLRGTLVDLPGRLAAVEADDRLELAPGSFFDPLPAGADVYLLSGVLNDWNDQEATAILRRCAEAAGTTGRVVVVGHLYEDHSAKVAGSANLMMLVLVGGKERTYAELADLALGAGLVTDQTGAGYVELVAASTEQSTRSRA
ncbi:class I SAM-dependent methyltransferase [Flindersiella endophytica]